MIPLPPTAVVQSPQPQDVIEVVGIRGNQSQKIDRRVFRVQRTPHSAQKDAIQLLRGLPAVTVSTDGTIQLLGSSEVRIFVDGKPLAAQSVSNFLRNLHGTDIERIEIITNPSAQYSAEGTAGIINFVLASKQSNGVDGTATVEMSSFGRVDSNASIKYKRGKLTYEIEAEGSDGSTGRSSSRSAMSIETSPGESPRVSGEQSERSSRSTTGSVSLKTTYELNEKTNVSAKVSMSGSRDRSTLLSDVEDSSSGSNPFSVDQLNRSDSTFLMAELALAHKGMKEGETLNASLQLFRMPNSRSRIAGVAEDGGSFSIDQNNNFSIGRAQLDWVHPMRKGQILSYGAGWELNDTSQHYRFLSVPTPELPSAGSSDYYSATKETLDAYVTFQQPIGDWTLMPGLRLEYNRRRISAAGSGEVTLKRANLFPSLHLDHQLSKALHLNISYSARIDRASPEQLRPYTTFEDIFTSVRGNPNLQDQLIDSYEASLGYHRKNVEATITLYDRETRHLWSTLYSAINQSKLYTWINAGHKRSSGAEFDLSTPIVKQLKFNTSLNAFLEMSPVETFSGTRNENRFRFSTNSTLEWQGAGRGQVPGDIIELQWQYFSPSRELQSHSSATTWLSASFTHSFNRSVSLTGRLDYLAAVRRQLASPLIQEFSREHIPLQFSVKLLKTFGHSG